MILPHYSYTEEDTELDFDIDFYNEIYEQTRTTERLTAGGESQEDIIYKKQKIEDFIKIISSDPEEFIYFYNIVSGFDWHENPIIERDKYLRAGDRFRLKVRKFCER